jgi:queuine tRNA-ribosyltransferase
MPPDNYTSPVRLELLKTHASGARAGIVHTRRGQLLTPAFMPVATHANIRHIAMDEVGATGAKFLLANTYHLLLRPGVEVFERFGGIHSFMGWDHGVLTDSGGFQIFSLPEDREITEKGAHFRNPQDNHRHWLTPETSIATQQAIGSDIMMVLDVCLNSTSSPAEIEEAMGRTHRWALRSLEAARARPTGQALFAIVQGGTLPHLRTQSAEFLTQHPFDGFAIGGLAVGEARELLYAMTAHTTRLLPANKPRYLMGVGTPIDLVECVRRGADMFDCIIPTMMAQQGFAYTWSGQVRMARTAFRLSDEPLDADCDCPVCKRHSRGYLQHLMAGRHAFGARLLSVHNLHLYQVLMKRMRDAILEDRWDAEYATLTEMLRPKSKLPRKVEGAKEGDFEVVALRSGARAVRHMGHGEVMHPAGGPWEEANRLYVEQTALAQKLVAQGMPPLRILDIGLGAAANAVAALTAAVTLGKKRVRELEIVSLEIDLAPVRLALAHLDGFAYLKDWQEAVTTLMDQGRWEGKGLKWTLLHGDAREQLKLAGRDFDIVFHDPFSPEHNPTLWTVDWFNQVKAVCRDERTVLTTYSAATPTRLSLLLSGFFVGAGLSTGTRVETTIAAISANALERPLKERWLERWKRSSARAPHGQTFSSDIEQAVFAHPQFAPSTASPIQSS